MVGAGVAVVALVGGSATAVQAWPRQRTGQTISRASAETGTSTSTGTATSDPQTSTDAATPATTSTTQADESTTAATTSASTAAAATGDVIANLFEWNWDSVATECTDVLGPNGYGGVQVAPPQDSVKLDGDTHPWWEVYQPAGYDLNSRMGDEDDFISMVSTCRDAGVKVYVDTVINHMSGSDLTADGATSYSGNSYSSMTYPGLYISNDFHQADECPSSSGNVEDYEDATQVHFCKLSSLEDLRTESDYVRSAIATYMNKLLGYGVSGFRVDAAKHIPVDDLQAIEDQLDQTVDGTDPYLAFEVFGGSGELAPSAYTGLGSVLGLDASVALKDGFDGSISSLSTFGDDLVDSDSSLTFVMNHDTDRSGDSLTSAEAEKSLLATQFILADDYGTAQVYSSFTWSDSDDSPPADSDGMVTDTDCDADTWNCVDRDPAVLGMIAFRNSVAGTAVKNWSDDGANLISFNRGDIGWTALNNTSSDATDTFSTDLAEGTYCNLTDGEVGDDGACTGTTVEVGSDGTASVTVPAMSAIAITTDAML